MKNMEKVGTHNLPIFYWTVVEMYCFTDGTFWGKVLFSGSEKDCEDFVSKNIPNGPRWHQVAWPAGLGPKTVKSLEFNIIATNTPPTIYEQFDVGISGLQ